MTYSHFRSFICLTIGCEISPNLFQLRKAETNARHVLVSGGKHGLNLHEGYSRKRMKVYLGCRKFHMAKAFNNSKAGSSLVQQRTTKDYLKFDLVASAPAAILHAIFSCPLNRRIIEKLNWVVKRLPKSINIALT